MIGQEIGNAYGYISIAFQSQGCSRKAIEYHEKHLKITMEVGDRAGEEKGHQNLAYAFQSLGDFRKAIKYHEKQLEIAIEAGHRVG